MKTRTLKTKAMSILLAIVMLLGMLPMNVFAADTKPSYVALGDSISTGYGLADKTTQGFTYMLANSSGYTLTNLAVDGNTAAGILTQLGTDAVKTAVTNADLITITAGGNDLMAALYQALADYYNTQYNLTGDAAVSGNDIVDAFAGNDSNLSLTLTDMNAMLGIVANFATTQNFTDALDSYTTNMFGDGGIITTILTLNPDVKIVVTTQYNPYIVFDGALLYGNLYTGIEAGLSGDNGLNAVINSNAASKGYTVADVYTAFKNSSDNLCNAGTVDSKTNLDFHPNAAGHYVFANTVAYACNPTGYSITFDANGGTGYMATAYASDIYIYPECGFTAPEGYRFAGWSRYANSSFINASGHTIIPSSNVTLYARWELIPTLSTPTNLRWNGMVAEWDAVEGADGYTVEFEFSIGSSSGGNSGYYYTNYIDYSYADSSTPWRFRVKAQANNGNAVSEWSDWSDIVAALEPGQLTAPILPDWQGFWPNWRVASEFNGEKHKFVATLYKEGVTDAITVIEGMPPHDINEIVRENGSGTYYFTVKTISLDGTAESKIVTSPKKAIDVNKIPQLVAPTNLRWNDTKAEWDAANGATKYYFELFRNGSRVMRGDGSNTYEECGFLFDEDDFGSGVYTFRVTALAQENGVTLAQAVSEMSGKYIALDAPQNIAWDGTVARWGSVENATGYRVYLDCPDELPTQISDVSGTQKDMKEYFTEAGDYTFYVYAYAEVEGYGGQMLSGESASAVYPYDPNGFTVTIINGTGSGKYTVSGAVTIKPNEPVSGYRFGWWDGIDGLSFYSTNETTGECVLKVPGRDVTMTAVYEKLPAEAPTVTASGDLTLTYKGYTDKQVSVSVTEKTGYTYSYQWYDASTDQPISGATNAAYTIPNDLAAGSYSYSCVVTAKRDDNGETSSSKSSDIAVTVTKGTQEVSWPIAGAPETVYGKNDGKITDVDSGMEYRKASETDAEYKPITGAEITGLAAGTYYVRLKETDNLFASAPVTVTIAAGGMLAVTVPQNQIGYTLTANNTELAWHGSTTLAFALADGYSKTNEFSVSATGATLTDNGDGTYTLSNAEDNVTVTVNGVADITAPEAEISISTNRWTEFLNNITFGLFFKETQDITITATDAGSGLDKIYYLISETELTKEAAEALANDFWTEYDAANKPSINPDKECIVYVKVIDKAQNVKVISSNGLVFDATAPTLEGIENGKTYYGQVVFGVTDGLAGIDKVEIDGVDKTHFEGQYVINPDNKEHTVIATDKAGNKTEYKITVYKNYTVDIGECHYVGCVISGGGSYEHGETVTLTATPTDGTEFKYWLNADIAAGWEDDPSEAELRAAIVSYDTTYTFTAEKDVSLEAVFSGSDEIAITAMLIAGTDTESLFAAEWWDVEHDFGTVTPGAEQIVLPGELVDNIVTVGNKQYQFKGFIVFGYDEATETETAELKETLTIGKMPLYGSAEYWDWFNSISDGIHVAYMEYTPEEDDSNDPQQPADPETPDDTKKPSSPKTGDNSHLALWIAFAFISGGAVITLTVYDRKRRSANR